MALSKKKSRPITVDGEAYRYQISTSKRDTEKVWELNITIEKSGCNKGFLTIKGLWTRDWWLDFSDKPSWNENEYPVIKPKHISWFISEAKNLGWLAESDKNEFILSVSNNKLSKVGA